MGRDVLHSLVDSVNEKDIETVCSILLKFVEEDMVAKPKYNNLRERLEVFYQRPIDEIYVESTQAVDVGDPLGNEQW